MRVVMLTGPFDEADLALLAKTLRQIEQHRPEGLYTLLVLDDETGLAEAQNIVGRIFPPRTRPQ